MATNGVTFKNFMAGPNCSASRQKLMGFGEAHRPTNLTGQVIQGTNSQGEDSWPTEVVINTHDKRSLFWRMKSHGYTTYQGGKWHIFPDRLARNMSTSIAQAMGVDVMPLGLKASPGVIAWTMWDNGVTPTEATFLGQNCFVSFDLNNNVALQNEFADDMIFDDAVDYLQNAGATGNHFMLLNPVGTHAPSDSTTTSSCPSTTTRDDRPPTGAPAAGSSLYTVFNSSVEYIDSRIANIRSEMSLDPINGTDILCVTSDNGIQVQGLPTEVPNNLPTQPFHPYTNRAKGTPYPAGLEVPLICEGKGIAAGSVVTARFGMSDLNKTFDAILGNGGGGGHLDGQSFADCFDDNDAATNCVGHDVTVFQRFGPVGGQFAQPSTYRLPPTDGLVGSAPFNKDWLVCVTGTYWLTRFYSPTVAPRGNVYMYEELFDETEAGINQYFNIGDEIATSHPGGTIPPVGGKITDLTGLSDADISALEKCQYALDSIQTNEGRFAGF
jgi:hypothetical protein